MNDVVTRRDALVVPRVLLLAAALAAIAGCPRAAVDDTGRVAPGAPGEAAPSTPTALAPSALQPLPPTAIPRLAGPPPAGRSVIGDATGGYQFKWPDYVKNKAAFWRRILAPYVGVADLHYLEIGTLEGRSLLWMLDNIFTHPTSRATAIDITLQPNLLHNVAVARANDRVTLYEARSELALRQLPHDSVDVAYIDGSHRLVDCLSDAVRVWPLLHDGGVIIFDDYDYNLSNVRKDMSLPAEELLPRRCVEVFVAGVISEVEILAWNEVQQVAIRKRVNRCNQYEAWKCTPLGERYEYDWVKSELLDRRTDRRTHLNPAEQRGLEKLYASRRPDAPRFNVDAELAADPDVREFLLWFKLDASVFAGGVAPAIAQGQPGSSRREGARDAPGGPEVPVTR